MTCLIVIRPQPGCDATVAAARALGMEAHDFPLFEVRPVAWQGPDPGAFDALLIGSANALRHAGPALAAYRGKPVYAVGESTADAARGMGFTIAATGRGGLQDLLHQIAPDHRTLLRLAGRAHVEIALPQGVSAIERIVYASEPLPMSGELARLLGKGAVVALHSAEAARHFAEQCDDQAIARNRIGLAALAPRIAEAAGQGWAAVETSPLPNDDALLAMALQICQKPGELEG